MWYYRVGRGGEMWKEREDWELQKVNGEFESRWKILHRMSVAADEPGLDAS